MKAFPLFISVSNRPVVVFGGDEEAAAKLRLLLKTEAQVMAVAAEFEACVAELPGLTLVTQDPLSFTLPQGTPFAYAATGIEEFDSAIAAHVRAQGILVCAADQPGVSDFSTPAMVDRDPVVIAIGTEGTAPVLSRNIKAEIEFMLEPALGAIARFAGKFRPAVAQRLNPGLQRRAFWRSFFAAARQERQVSPVALDVLANQLMERPEASVQQGSLTVIGTGSGDTDFLAQKALKLIDAADVVIHDALVSRDVLELARREAFYRPLNRVSLAGIESDHHTVVLVSGDGAAQSQSLPQAAYVPGITDNRTSPSAASPAPRRLAAFFTRKAA